MKLAMYHRLQGDDVVFYKGELSQFILMEVVQDTILKLSEIYSIVDWKKMTPEIQTYIKIGKINSDTAFELASQRPFVLKWLEHFKKYYHTGGYYLRPRWDRVCVTTLFTFYWDITIETIEFAKKVCKYSDQVLVGGILASVIPIKVKEKTGITPIEGCLYCKSLRGDPPIGKPIDTLPLDYSILEEIDYQYPASDAYYAYATRGCINRCEFCAVPILEPGHMRNFPIKSKLNEIKKRFGEQRNLLLLDNNVFASEKFDKIIDEIHDSGFYTGATYIPPNKLDIAARQLKDGWNDRAYIRMATRLINEFVEKLEGERHDAYYSMLMDMGLLHNYTATKDNILSFYKFIKDDYEKARSKRPLVRFIDFNQGMDAAPRLATQEKMKKLATIAIRPLRIAFDSWSEREIYVRAIRLAKENDITQMSNYLLYNFRDAPIDLYRRLLLNIDLCDALGVNIYSFPMKYHPIMEEEWYKNRDYIDRPNWTRKSIRTIQAVLNSTAGKIGKGRTFFFKAFGRNEEEFEELLRMPEAFIIKRWDAELSGLTDKWRKAYNKLSDDERNFSDKIIAENIFESSKWQKSSANIKKVLDIYTIERDDIPLVEEEAKTRHIRKFEQSCPKNISAICTKLLEKGKF
ncbi:hypothetical protein [Leadbettera azotonutricia]|nr:hypothetical protein [Leadbettera azotonutricia]